MTRYLRITAAIGMLILAMVGRATAQITLDLLPATQSGSPGGTLDFIGKLMNTGMDTAFLNGASANVSSLDLSTDTSPFLINAPLSLASGDSWQGNVFDVTIDSTIAPGDYTGVFTVLGGTDPNALDEIASAQFTVDVVGSQSVPEPAGLALLSGLLVSGTAIFIRSRR